MLHKDQADMRARSSESSLSHTKHLSQPRKFLKSMVQKEKKKKRKIPFMDFFKLQKLDNQGDQAM